MKGKVCLITGANAGIGRATALELAKKGATAVLVCRNLNRGQEAQAAIIAESGNDAVDLIVADLSSQKQIVKLANEFKQKYDRLDVLINNAGAVFGSRMVTEDGLEMTFALNHLAYFQLTNLLLDLLKASEPARIINISSMAHKQGNIYFDDLQLEKKYGSNRAYSQSKLANVLFTYQLSRRLQGTNVTANAMNPGMVATNFARDNTPLLVRILFRGILRPFALSPPKGAETVIYLASAQEVEGVTGKYFEKLKSIKSSELSYDQNVANKLWQASAQLVGMVSAV